MYANGEAIRKKKMELRKREVIEEEMKQNMTQRMKEMEMKAARNRRAERGDGNLSDNS